MLNVSQIYFLISFNLGLTVTMTCMYDVRSAYWMFPSRRRTERFSFPPVKCAFLFFIFMPCRSKWDPSHNAPIQMLQYNKNRKTHCKILITCKCPCALVLMCSATGIYHAKCRVMILFGVSACVRFDSYDKQDNTSRDESSVIQSDLFCLNGVYGGLEKNQESKWWSNVMHSVTVLWF